LHTLPEHCSILVIGGGIIGSSCAYHLAELGETDCTVLEQGKLTNGSTWHAAGLVGQLRSSANVTQLLKYSVELYARLEAQTGLATGWKQNGGLRLAAHRERVREINRQITMARSFGLEMHFLSPREIAELCPLVNTKDLLGGAFIPSDGQANSSDLSQSLAKGARQKGVRFVENCEVQKIRVENSHIAAIETDLGKISCEAVVICAGLWSRHLGSLAGVEVPIVPMKHHYIVTGKVDGVQQDMPTIRDPDSLIYFKEEVGGLVFGGYELNPQIWKIDRPPDKWYFSLLDFDVEHFESLMKSGISRIPAMESADIKEMICGPESFTPDGNFIIGKVPQLKNLFVGTGFNAFGIASAGGAGKALAEWVSTGDSSIDLGAVDVRRFGQVHKDFEWVKQRTVELCSKHYTMSWPHEEHTSVRPHFQSPLYDELKKLNVSFGEKTGWERPNWYARIGQSNMDEHCFGRANWFSKVGDEHCAIRQQCGMIDQSSFGKFLLKGKDSLQALQSICSNRMDRPIGTVVYTQMLNEKGGIECDVTITRLGEGEFLVVAGTGYASHHFHHIRNCIPKHLNDVALIDVTHKHATLSVSGPNTRELLQSVVDVDLSNESFRFLTCKRVRIHDRDALALRVSFAGELGWELHMPVENAVAVFRLITNIGKQFGLEHVGYRALESLRLEKGFRALGTDIGPDYTPFEAGMGNVVNMTSDLPFIGLDALRKQQLAPLTKRLACFTTPDEAITLHGRETIFRDGVQVGWTTSAGWGYTVKQNIAYGYVRNSDAVSDEYLQNGDYELEVEQVRVPVKYAAEPLYDPKARRMRS